MIRTASKRIGKNEYVVNTLPATEGLLAFGKLAPLFSLAAMGADTGAAIAQGIRNFDAAAFEAVAKVFAMHTTVNLSDGRSPRLNGVFDEHFSGEYLELTEWFAFCVECNYSTFFAGLVEKVAAMTKPLAKPTQ